VGGYREPAPGLAAAGFDGVPADILNQGPSLLS